MNQPTTQQPTSRQPASNRVVIFDTTLRDGEQSPGCSMTQPEKLRVAEALAELEVQPFACNGALTGSTSRLNRRDD